MILTKMQADSGGDAGMTADTCATVSSGTISPSPGTATNSTAGTDAVAVGAVGIDSNPDNTGKLICSVGWRGGRRFHWLQRNMKTCQQSLTELLISSLTVR